MPFIMRGFSLRNLLILAAALLIIAAPFRQTASAHAYSAAYNTLTLTKTQTTMIYSLDELSAIELAGGDADDNKMLDPEEFSAIKDKLAAIIAKNVTLKIGGEEQPWTSLESFELDREGDASKVVLRASYPPVTATQPISLKDELYQGDAKTNYVDLLTIEYGPLKSTAALSANDRVWAMQLTDGDYAGLAESPIDKAASSGSQTDKGASGESAAEQTSSHNATSGWFSFSN